MLNKSEIIYQFIKGKGSITDTREIWIEFQKQYPDISYPLWRKRLKEFLEQERKMPKKEKITKEVELKVNLNVLINKPVESVQVVTTIEEPVQVLEKPIQTIKELSVGDKFKTNHGEITFIGMKDNNFQFQVTKNYVFLTNEDFLPKIYENDVIISMRETIYRENRKFKLTKI